MEMEGWRRYEGWTTPITGGGKAAKLVLSRCWIVIHYPEVIRKVCPPNRSATSRQSPCSGEVLSRIPSLTRQRCDKTSVFGCDRWLLKISRMVIATWTVRKFVQFTIFVWRLNILLVITSSLSDPSAIYVRRCSPKQCRWSPAPLSAIVSTTATRCLPECQKQTLTN